MMIGITIKQPMTLNASFIKRPPCKLKFSISLFARRFDFCRWNSKIMVICASVCMPGMPDWLDLERYSFWLRHTWAADYTGHEHTSTWHFENPNHVRRSNIHKYNKLPVSTEIQGLVFFEPLSKPYFFTISMIRTSDQLGFLESRNAFTALRVICVKLTTVFPAYQVVWLVCLHWYFTLACAIFTSHNLYKFVCNMRHWPCSFFQFQHVLYWFDL